jgi:hypothetical protein
MGDPVCFDIFRFWRAILTGAIVYLDGVVSIGCWITSSHGPDLPLSVRSNRLLGLGLWNYRWQTVAVEFSY